MPGRHVDDQVPDLLPSYSFKVVTDSVQMPAIYERSTGFYDVPGSFCELNK